MIAGASLAGVESRGWEGVRAAFAAAIFGSVKIYDRGILE